MRSTAGDMPLGRIIERYGLLSVFVVTYFIGVFFGAALSLSISGEKGMELTGLVKSLSLKGKSPVLWQAFFSSFQNIAFFLLAVFLCGMMLVGFAFLFLVLFYKGYTVGFAVGFVCSVYGFKGLLICLLCILPQALITTAALFLAGKKAFDFSFSMFGIFLSKSQKHAQIEPLSRYCFGFLIYLAVSLGSMPFDMFIAPFFAKMLL